MNTLKISDRVYYIGVNDRVSHRFEGLWPLPGGVSYNSYLVDGGDALAIIDGVHASRAESQIDSIRRIAGDREPAYLIINHMEPDHSGALRQLLRAFPGLTVVGNKITLSMVEGFYGPVPRSLAVADGDTLALGADTTLRFVMTPMVHWPETMMTRLEEEAVLFSGDAFGCFGALNGAVLDTDMSTDAYFPEMTRYYSNIVGKYGVHVQKALGKLAGMRVDTICPTHGPVWRERRYEVISLYDRLSRYEPLDNGVTVVYGSMYGNTELMAETAAAALAGAGVRDIVIRNASETHLSYILADIFTHRGLVIAAPTYSDGLFPPVAEVLRAMAVRGVKGRDAVVIGSHTWSQRAVAEIAATLDTCGIAPAAEPVVVKQAAKAPDLEQCRLAGEALARRLMNC